LEKNGNERIKRHKALIRQYFRAYDTDDINAVLKFIHQNHVHHPGAGAPMSFVQRKRDDEVFFKAFSKIHTTVEDLIAEGNKVVSRVTMEADHTGEYQGLRPTGKRIKITFIDIARIAFGKIVEEWTEFDMLSIIQQLGPKQ
jgi:predicted ester cyclase